ncbi:hypothetical protein LB522_11315 [Mesorhizobium sp. CA9]|nr:MULTISPECIES: hypothetical protein [unclassified Mesorhizobium]MBZ9733987.1 hypothetical protein [Mesorhizobium sp. CA9]MBZ9832315.1 hypothetical protein [Mesorhizobium sp. CA2]MBZ9836535.1 hypothetical protein [Mesorhizobium sp. CA3]MBZ9878155.1 hypothetical protein [Mesorhizobium sp. Ca11]MBZ9901049.1 hypothetical protein [Mesorhizobium sp. CA17]
MDIIGNAHREFGTAVIVVTHDEDVAALCGRRVEISDGRIRSDSRAAAISAPAPASRIG